ncbi:MAG: hypothetical protein R6U32_01310 [Candidatus Woesearchaeota archaeon]
MWRSDRRNDKYFKSMMSGSGKRKGMDTLKKGITYALMACGMIYMADSCGNCMREQDAKDKDPGKKSEKIIIEPGLETRLEMPVRTETGLKAGSRDGPSMIGTFTMDRMPYHDTTCYSSIQIPAGAGYAKHTG